MPRFQNIGHFESESKTLCSQVLVHVTTTWVITTNGQIIIRHDKKFISKLSK